MSSSVGVLGDVGGEGSQSSLSETPLLPAPVLSELQHGVSAVPRRLLDDRSEGDADGTEPSPGSGQGHTT